MTSNKYIELYNFLENHGIVVLDISKLKNMSDEEIDIVMKSKNCRLIINMFMSDNFIKLDKDTRIKLANLVIESKYPISAIHVATDKYAISTGKVVELVESVNNSVTERNAILARYKAVDKVTTRSKNIVEIIEKIASPLGYNRDDVKEIDIEKQILMGELISDIADVENLVLSNKVLDLANLIIYGICTNRYKNCLMVRDLCKNQFASNSNDIVNYANYMIISEEPHCKIINRIATDKNALDSGLGILLAANIPYLLFFNRTKEEYEIIYGIVDKVVDNLPILGVNQSYYYLSLLNNPTMELSSIENRLNDTINNTGVENDTYNFWNLAKYNSRLAKDSLINGDNVDLRPDTKVRIKKLESSNN